jgi:hypothetical protein
MSENQEAAAVKAVVKPTLTISQLQADLKAGLSRKEQAKKYGVPLAALARAYKHPELKGKRKFSARGTNGKAAVEINLIDDVSNTDEATQVEPSVQAPVATPESDNASNQEAENTAEAGW